MSLRSLPAIELLESRIAPAALFVSPTTAQYTDQDGDLVTVKFSKPILSEANIATILPTTDTGAGAVLDAIVLAAFPAAAGTAITVSAAVAAEGDGLANVGIIDAVGLDLGAVTIKGDLTTILVGDATTRNGGLKSLTVTSFGLASSLAGNVPAASAVAGSLGSLVVKTDIVGASLDVIAATAAEGKIGSIVIGGSVNGGLDSFGGSITAEGNIGRVTIAGSLVGGLASSGRIISFSGNLGAVSIGGNLRGGSEAGSGTLFGASIASLKVGGDLLGGTAENTGRVTADKIGAVTILGSIFGGAGENSGKIIAGGSIGAVKIGNFLQGSSGANSGQIIGNGIGSVTIGGSLIGGTGDSSGTILSAGNIGAVKIVGDFIGGGADETTTDAGQIWAFGLEVAGRIIGGNITSVTIGGSASAGSNEFCGAILAEAKLGPVKIGQDIFSTGGGDFIIRALGDPTAGNAIASVTVGGSVSQTRILAGFSFANEALNPNASIGAIKVGGSWTASSIAAGVRNLGTDDALGGSGSAFDNFNFGDSHDRNYNPTTLVTRIASISIGGAIFGTSSDGDHFGFVAGQIGSLKIGGTVIPLNPAAASDNRLIGLTGDFRVHEV